jgi:putative Ca2+/H+ antiporter (TMEM165/GDT1 family)
VEALWISTGIVALAEIGDKTQLLAFLLAARFKKPLPIIAGILCATVVNHGLAGALGAWITASLSPEILRWVLGASFIGMAVWTLIPDKIEDDEGDIASRWGVFGATLVTFFLAEMGDKTQIATVAMAAHFADPVLVVVGTTLGMLIADVPAVFIGERLSARIPMRLVHGIAAALFAGSNQGTVTLFWAPYRLDLSLNLAIAIIVLAFVFSAQGVVHSGIGTHLPGLLMEAGATPAAAIAAATLLGPAQVAARVAEFGLMRRMHPLVSARIATMSHPAAAVALLLGGPALAPLFAALHGGGSGLLSISRGALPLALFGPNGYGRRQGLIALPSNIATATAPLIVGLSLDFAGPTAVLLMTTALAIAATLALLALHFGPISTPRPPLQ